MNIENLTAPLIDKETLEEIERKAMRSKRVVIDSTIARDLFLQCWEADAVDNVSRQRMRGLIDEIERSGQVYMPSEQVLEFCAVARVML